MNEIYPPLLPNTNILGLSCFLPPPHRNHIFDKEKS